MSNIVILILIKSCSRLNTYMKFEPFQNLIYFTLPTQDYSSLSPSKYLPSLWK